MAEAAAVAEPVDREWIVRPYDPNGYDEDGLHYLLGVAYSRSRSGRRAGVSGHRDGGGGIGQRQSGDDADMVARQRAYLAAHAPIWRWLLDHADVTLAVDRTQPERWIIGWAVTSGDDVVHAIGVKRDWIKVGCGWDIVRDLVGDRIGQHQVLTLELPQFRSGPSSYRSSDIVGERPTRWSLDPTWLLTRMVSR